jgi:hypothetical protein
MHDVFKEGFEKEAGLLTRIPGAQAVGKAVGAIGSGVSQVLRKQRAAGYLADKRYAASKAQGAAQGVSAATQRAQKGTVLTGNASPSKVVKVEGNPQQAATPQPQVRYQPQQPQQPQQQWNAQQPAKAHQATVPAQTKEVKKTQVVQQQQPQQHTPDNNQNQSFFEKNKKAITIGGLAAGGTYLATQPSNPQPQTQASHQYY